MDRLCVFLLSFVTLTVPGVNTSHFRGAIISWRPGSAKNEIIIDYRISWRRSSSGHFCNSSTIQTGETVTGEGTLSCFYNCQGGLGPLHYQCTDYSLNEDWTSGKGRIIKTLPLRMSNTTRFEFGYNGGNWIGSLNIGSSGSWQLKVKGDLAVRNDTGTINSSPRAEITPIVRLQYGCNHAIKIPVSDPDQDIVKCRWASSSQNECGSVCNGFPNAHLNSTACTLTYGATYSTGWYAVAIQVEDYENEYDNQPLSSIPVQFLVQVYRSSDSCSVKPEFVDPSPKDGACIVVPINETFETTITAHIKGSNRSIAEIKTTSPLGMIKSPLIQINSTTWQVNVTWAPTAINDTSNVFCFTATDTSGQQSERRCITLLSGVSKPRFIDGYGSQSPIGVVSPDQRRWTVAVDSPFVRGSKHSYIRLYSERGSLLETVDVTDSRRVTLNSYNQSLEFTTSTTLHENQTYYFLFDSGVVRSASYCGTDSEEIRNPYFWRIFTEAVPVRLVNGTSEYSGRVEVYHGGAWGTVCDDAFDRKDAEVICRMLGMFINASEIVAFRNAHFGQGSGRIVLDDLQCYGNESSLEHCRSSGWMNENCDHDEDAAVSCHDSIRLVNGKSNYSGRVEVFHDGEWGTVCDDSFDSNDGKVICRLLGMYDGDSSINVYPNAHFGQGSGRIALDELHCNGYEHDINDCRSQAWFVHDCSHSEDAGVDCNAASLRLVNGSSIYSGRVEVFHDGEWGTVCDDDFDRNDGKVICRQLGMYYGDSLINIYTNAHFGQGSGRIALDDLICNGYEQDIDDCRSRPWFEHNCHHNEDAGVDCKAYELTTASWWHSQAAETTEVQTQIRLVNGSSYHSGRVEVYHNGAWGTVCDDNVDRNVVRVICKMLGMYYGYSYGVPYGSAYFGEGSGRIALDDLHCNGYESDITQCMRSSWYSNDCSHGEDAGVDCYEYDMTTSDWRTTYSIETTEVQTPIRLINGPTYYSGRVEVYHNGAWGTVCDDGTNNRTVKVICKMLGMYIGDSYGRPYSSAHFGQGNGSILLDDLNCNGYESDITQCMTSSWYANNCGHSEDFGVDCHGYIYGGTSLPRYTRYTTRRNYFTTTTYRPWYTTAGYSLADAIQVSCDENGWNIRVNLALLRNIHPGAVASDIYLGENTCTGIESWNTVTFHQGLHECLTSQMVRNNVLVYRNQLVYAQRDLVHPFLIRHYNWTIGVECDVDRNETTSGHIHHDTGSNPVDSVLGSSHYFVNMSFFSDPNFMYRIHGNPIHVAVGTKVYVKVFSTTSDWTIKLKVHTCYTKPTATASDHLKYEIIKNGCEMDSNTHIISQSSHETRFVFEDFEYTSNHEGLYVFCDAIFCRSTDYSRQCMQTCNP